MVCNSEFELKRKLLKVCDFNVSISPSLFKRKFKIDLRIFKSELFLISEEGIQKLLSHIHI